MEGHSATCVCVLTPANSATRRLTVPPSPAGEACMCHGSHMLQEGAQELTPSCGGHQAQSALLHLGASWAHLDSAPPGSGLVSGPGGQHHSEGW